MAQAKDVRAAGEAEEVSSTVQAVEATPDDQNARSLERVSDEQDTAPSEGQSAPDAAPVETLQLTAGDTAIENSVDPNLVTWDGSDDQNNPMNWTFAKRWQITAISSAFTFISRLASSMIAPSLLSIAADLDIKEAYDRQLTLSSFVLAGAFGPLIAGPLSEVYGRQHVLQILNLFYFAFNTGCGFAQNGTQLIVLRFFAGLGGSAATVIGAGVLNDVWRADERGLSVSIYTSITLISPTIGPLLGGFITHYSSWRWTFWSVSIADLVVQLIGLAVLRETYPPAILGRKAAALRKDTGNQQLYTKWQKTGVTFKRRLFIALSRPVLLLCTQPICWVFALYSVCIFGLIYLALATYAELWIEKYNQSVSIAGLNYLALALGYIIGIQTCARAGDWLYHRLIARHGEAKPEHRIPLILHGAVLMPAGMLWYGWSAQNHLFWLMPDIGIAIFAIGTKYSTQAIQLYSLDVYPTYAASASAMAQFVRSLAGFAFPVFAPYMYSSLGYGWGNSILALIGVIMGIVIPPLLWIYGPYLRRKSPYATG